MQCSVFAESGLKLWVAELQFASPLPLGALPLFYNKFACYNHIKSKYPLVIQNLCCVFVETGLKLRLAVVRIASPNSPGRTPSGYHSTRSKYLFLY